MVIKYMGDTRYFEKKATTHDKVSMSALVCGERLSTISDAVVDRYDVIGIDEGQFFLDIVEWCRTWSDRGKIIVVAALDATYERKAFGNILGLIPIAEYVEKLTAVCMVCAGHASFTTRTSNDTVTKVIAGADKYVAMCRACYITTQRKKSEEKKTKKKSEAKKTKKTSEAKKTKKTSEAKKTKKTSEAKKTKKKKAGTVTARHV